MAAKKPKQDKLRIELDASASPERVAATATMIADAVKAIDPGLAESITMVVSNFELKAEVRGLGSAGAKVVKKIGGVLEHPERSLARDAKLPVVADVLARGLEGMGDITASLFWGSSKAPFKRDSGRAIASGMKDASKRAKKAAAQPPPEVPPAYPKGERLLRTSLYTPVMRFGRASEAAKFRQVRIVVFGVAMEVEVPPELQTVCANLSATDDHYRVLITGKWVHREGRDELDDIKLVGIDPNDKAMTSSDFIERVRAKMDVFTDGLDELRENIAELRSE